MESESHTRRIYDVVVFGDSCAAFGAAVALRRAGQSVLLVSRHTGLLREASWSFVSEAREGRSNAWAAFSRFLESREAMQFGQIDGGCCEVAGAEFAQKLGIDFLFYAAPFAWEEDSNLVARVGFATKQGETWIAARRWMDASHRRELTGVINDRVKGPIVASNEWTIFFRHPQAFAHDPIRWVTPLQGIESMTFGQTIWPNETVVRYRSKADRPRTHTFDVLKFVRQEAALEKAVVSHGSFVPLEHYCVDEPVIAALPANLLTLPIATDSDLGQRFDAGVRAAEDMMYSRPADGLPGSRVASPFATTESFDVAVAGLGTGGALAALAAAREGAKVGAIELLPTFGGVGTSGGIHLYYFGVEGGLQREIDLRVSEKMPLFGARKNVAGFHPMAKSVVIESMLHEAGVRVFSETMMGRVEGDSRISSVQVIRPNGTMNLTAGAWVDSTGDGDLAVRAGAGFQTSARSDGLPSAFSQGSGRFRWREGELFLRILNFDAGFVDPTDSWDLTRARLRGLEHYRRDAFTAEERPTYIAPLIGVRQSRHISTELQITLEDLATKRRFPDAVGYTACHFDSHAIDFEFESEDAAFWIWGCRNWRLRTGCEIPYRALLPKGVANLLLGCRAVGATPDAHQSFRMQRDMQRVGEVAGVAAAFAAKFDCNAAEVPYEWLRKRLELTGALTAGEDSKNGFGYHVEKTTFVPAETDVATLVGETRAGFGIHMYLLSRAGEAVIPALRPLLGEGDAASSWRAAVVLAMLGDEHAEPRLLRAVATREEGYEPDDPRHPKRCPRLAPNWISALVFLRRCASMDTVGILEDVSEDPGLVHNARTGIALLCHAMAARLDRSAATVRRIDRILNHLEATSAPNAIGHPQRSILGPREPSGDGIWYPDVVEDFRWQLRFANATARRAWGIRPSKDVQPLLDDPRAPVRRAFESLLVKSAGVRSAEGALHS